MVLIALSPYWSLSHVILIALLRLAVLCALIGGQNDGVLALFFEIRSDVAVFGVTVDKRTLNQVMAARLPGKLSC